MNNQRVMYMLRDAREGIMRNLGAATSAALLIFVAMAFCGILLLLRLGVGDLMHYLESQVTMKVYLDPSVDTEAVAKILQNNSYVKTAEVETKEQMLERLSFFFTGREHLLLSFQESDIPDAIRLELADKSQMGLFAEQLGGMKEIIKVVYPQQFAETILKWSEQINQYGILLLALFVILAFGMVFIAMSLALYQRRREIRVRMLIGAKPAQVRGQFLFEGWLIGLIGSLLAAIVVYFFFTGLLVPLQLQFPFALQFSMNGVYLTMVAVVVAGSLVGLAASYVSTRKQIDHA
ncbi:cell division protein FtsX [Brevibacillus centrosporus]|uniref:cell division protein FtsX n=1 Tax=Brevibacillus centrosporus TaxID=54910 RepID=UPI003986C0AF